MPFKDKSGGIGKPKLIDTSSKNTKIKVSDTKNARARRDRFYISFNFEDRNYKITRTEARKLAEWILQEE